MLKQTVELNEPFITDSDLDKLFCEYAITNYRDMKILRDIVHEVNTNQNFDLDKMQEIQQSLKEGASITILYEFLRTFTCGFFNPNLGEDEFIKKHPWKKRNKDAKSNVKFKAS